MRATAAATTSNILNEVGRRLPVRAEQASCSSPTTRRSPASCCSRSASARRFPSGTPSGRPACTAKTVSITDVGLGKTYGAVAHLSRPSGLHQPLHAVRGAITYVTGIAHVQGRVPSRAPEHRQLLHRRRQRPVHVPERRAASHPAAHHALSGVGSDRRSRHVLAGSVAAEQVHLQLRPAVRLRQRLHPDRRTCRARPIRSSTIASPAFQPSTPWVGTRTFDAVNGIPTGRISTRASASAYDLFGNGRTAIKIARRPVCGQDQRRRRRAAQPDHHDGQHRHPFLGRRQQQLLSRLRPGQLRRPTASAARSTTRTSARRIQTRCSGPTRAERLGRARLQLGLQRGRSSTS